MNTGLSHDKIVRQRGSDTGNAIKNENKVREQLGTGQDQQRKANPKHVE